MTAKTTRPKELKSLGYEMFIGALSVLSIINLVLIVHVPAEREPAVRRVLS